MVWCIHRPEYYNRAGTDAEGKDIRGLAEFIVAKHRSGSVDDVPMRFKAKFARFQNWEDDYEVIQNTYESKMNQNNNDFLNEASAPAPNVDFLMDKNDSPTPF